MRRTSFGKRLVPAAQRLRRAGVRRGAVGTACGGDEGPRGPHRLGRTGAGRGRRGRPRDRPVVLRPLERRMSRPPEPKLVTSLTNATVKSVRALHMRKEREETGLFLAEGL